MGTWVYEDVYNILKNFQQRGPVFGNARAARPRVWPPGVPEPGPGGSFLLWISGEKHTAYRRAMHTLVISKFELIKSRFNMLQTYLTPYVKTVPKDPAEFLKIVTDSPDTITELISRTMWLIVFGVQLTQEELTLTAKWASSAAYFVLPQFVQNLAFGILARKVATLRRNMVTIMCRRPGVIALFKELKPLMDTTSVGGKDFSEGNVETWMDEVQFVVNFAGLLGTKQLFESTVYALNRKVNPDYVMDDQIHFPEMLTKAGKQLTYVEAYNEDPIAFVKEVARLDPPVTSANNLTQEALKIETKCSCCCGGKVNVPVGTGNQYLMSIANRDESKFPTPLEFNPFRDNNDDILSWNGKFPFLEEVQDGGRSKAYDPMGAPTFDPNGKLADKLPLTDAQKNNWNRVCPGRNIALQTVVMILGICPALNQTNLSIKWTNNAGP